MPLTPEQQTFLKKHLGGFFSSKKSDAKLTSDYEAFLEAEAKFFEVRKRVPEGTDGMAAALNDHYAAIAYREAGKLSKARTAMDRVLVAGLDVEQRLIATRADLLQRGASLTLAKGAIQSEQDFFDKAGQDVVAALTDTLPGPDKLVLARKALERAAVIAARTGTLKDLSDRNPKAAAAAHLAFASMREKTGGGEITPERIREAEDTAAEARLEILRHDTEMRRAEALPVPNINAGIARMEQIVAARNAKKVAEKKEKAAREQATALLGTQLLTEALDKGPLSAKGVGRQMPDDAIEALIAGFAGHPRVAADAVGIAATALDPLAVAKGVPTVGAQVDAGFKAADGKVPDGLDPKAFAAQILTMGGTCGAGYFDKLDDYVRLGGLNSVTPLSDADDDTKSARGQKRSMQVAGHLVDGTGTLTLGSDEAKTAIGHMLFHPQAMASPTPALNKHVVETLTMLGRDPQKGQAEGILRGVTPPSPGKSGAKLVGSALGKGGDPSAGDVRQAVLGSMLQSVDQGPVGSCFATAPTRRMRELDPIEAMRKYTQLAVSGTFTSNSGMVIPAVTNLPPGEDPLIRSMEYTLATAIAREDAMEVRQQTGLTQQDACVALQTELKTTLTGGKKPNAVKLLSLLKSELSASYDPMIMDDVVSSDGSSDRGRFILSAADGTPFTTRATYEAKALEIALRAHNETKDTDNGKAIMAAISGAFMTQLDSEKFPPWKLESGGTTKEASTSLSGEGTPSTSTGKSATPSVTPEQIGTRTREVLTNLMGSFGSVSKDMTVLRTAGMHGFNGLPNHESVKDLMSGPGTSAEKIQKKLIDAGKNLAAKQLDVAAAQDEFDLQVAVHVQDLEQQISDPATSKEERKSVVKCLKKVRAAIKKARPAQASTLDQIITAVGDAIEPAYNREFVEEQASGAITQKYAMPQIVIADTNWGSTEDHTYFVVAPDPRTGEPMMWQKTDPPGTMSPLESKWIDAEWQTIT